MDLRPYQAEAIASTMTAWRGGMQRPAVVLPTGAGKTVVFTRLARGLHLLGHSPLVLVHRDELIRQTVDKFVATDPTLSVGVIQGKRLELADADVVVASVQTLIRRLDRIPSTHFDRVIVDECHHAAAKSYVDVLTHFGCMGGPGKALGVTATMSRADGGLGAVWDDVVFERDIVWGVSSGFLCPAEVRTVRLAGLNTDKVKAGADGDLAAGQLAKAMTSAEAGPTIAKAYAQYARGTDGRLRRGILFAPTIEMAETWSADLWAQGVRTSVVTGATKPDDRQAIYADLAEHRIDVIASVMVLTEGFDLPAVEVAVIARPTRSMALLTQMVGRVLRLSPSTGKTSALVLDVVGAMGAGLARTVDLSIPEPNEGQAPGEAEVSERLGLPIHDNPSGIPEHEWVAVSLAGEPQTAVRRRANHVEPEWLHTYGGVPFLPRTMDFKKLIYVKGGATLVKHPEGHIEALEVRGDVRDLHPGLAMAPGFLRATPKQLDLLRRLGFDGVTDQTSATEARRLLDVHFASKELDRVA